MRRTRGGGSYSHPRPLRWESYDLGFWQTMCIHLPYRVLMIVHVVFAIATAPAAFAASRRRLTFNVWLTLVDDWVVHALLTVAGTRPVPPTIAAAHAHKRDLLDLLIGTY